MVYFSPWKIALVIGAIVLALLFAAPNLLSERQAETLPDWVPNKQVSLGLDLQGGSHLLLEVQTDAVIREYLEGLVESVRTSLRNQRVRYTGLGIAGGAVTVALQERDRQAEVVRQLRTLDPNMELSELADGRVTMTLTETAVRDRRVSAVDQSIEIVRRRIDETGVREPTIQRQGNDRIVVQLPGIDDPERIKSLIGRTAKMTFHLLDDSVSAEEARGGRVPAGSDLLPALEPGPGESAAYVVRRRVMVSGDTLVDAQPTFDQRTNEPVVSFRFDSVGGRRFGEATRENVGKPFAIVLDGRVVSAPVIREPILGGSGQISGNFSVQAAQDLALLLRAGALPAPLVVLEERTVGPGLGADSIAAGKIASVVGFALVVAYMVLTYGFFGVLANIALVFNLVMILALLSLLQATLTLPGIAGIVLTLGMAVDANVLIFERMREEMRNGRGPISAIDAGYSRALSTIIDSNLTTLFATLLLFIFGAGPVRGFAVTLSIGIVTSMFTAIMVTRLMVVVWLRRRRPKTLPI